MTKQSPVHTIEIKRLRSALRYGNMKPIVRMSRTMKLLINDREITFVVPDPNVDSERLAARATRWWIPSMLSVHSSWRAASFPSSWSETVPARCGFKMRYLREMV